MEGERFPFRLEASPGVFWLTIVMWTILLGGGIVAAYAYGVRGAALAGLMLTALALLAFLAVLTRSDVKILFDDAIEFRTLFGATRFAIADLEGYQRRAVPGFPYAVAFHLIPKDRSSRERSLVTIPGASSIIDAWLAKLNDVSAG